MHSIRARGPSSSFPPLWLVSFRTSRDRLVFRVRRKAGDSREAEFWCVFARRATEFFLVRRENVALGLLNIEEEFEKRPWWRHTSARPSLSLPLLHSLMVITFYSLINKNAKKVV